MKPIHRKFFLFFSLVLIIILPRIGSFIRWGGLPPGYGEFPTRLQQEVPEPGFSWIYFTLIAAVVVLTLVFILFPRLFGFKGADNDESSPESQQNDINKKSNFAPWFWPAAVIMLISWVLMWGKFEFLRPVEHYVFITLWWGFIIMLDGWVYKRNGGVSIISSKLQTMIVLTVVSAASWFIFEYLNYFVLENWYYPAPESKIFTLFGNIVWYTLSYTVVFTAIFEWYSLLNTFKFLTKRYSNGPRITFPKPLLVVAFLLGILITFGMGLFPFLLFWGLWIGPLLLLSGAIMLTGYWTPYTPIKKGNWNPVILIALAALFTGFFWEFWNYGSIWFHPNIHANPNFWKYSIPYVNKIHIFSELPLLGFFGYLFFGIACWVFWLIIAHLFNFSPYFDLTPNKK